ncbi:MAG: SDR family NAD(P)-dependent oxidoreductase, partial [Bacteroidota bacterium]
MTLSDRTVLITGATSGVGRALAQACAARGARVLVHGRDRDRLHAAAADVSGTPIQADLSIANGVLTLATEARRLGPDLSVVIHNAAIQLNHPIVGAPPEAVSQDIAREIAVNLTAPAQLTALLLPTLRATAARTGSESTLVTVTSGLALARSRPRSPPPLARVG